MYFKIMLLSVIFLRRGRNKQYKDYCVDRAQLNMYYEILLLYGEDCTCTTTFITIQQLIFTLSLCRSCTLSKQLINSLISSNLAKYQVVANTQMLLKMFLLNSTFFKLLVLLIAHLQTGHSQNNSFLSAATVSATAIHQRRDKVRQVSENKCSAFIMHCFLFLYR